MKAGKLILTVYDLCCIALLVYLIISPQSASRPTREALEFCAKTLVPALFIYMVLSKTVISLPLTNKLIRIIGLEALMLLSGMLCGCPIGAKNALTLYENEAITKKHAEYLTAFTNNASLSFVLGYVGTELFDDKTVGLKLVIFQLVGSLTAAVVMKFIIFGKERLPKVKSNITRRIDLREAVSDSAMTVINLCACAVFFIVIAEAATSFLGLSATATAVLKAALEFSSGCHAALAAERYGFVIAAFAIGFCGLSVALQVKSVLANKLSMRPYLVGKLVSGTAVVLLAVIFG